MAEKQPHGRKKQQPGHLLLIIVMQEEVLMVLTRPILIQEHQQHGNVWGKMEEHFPVIVRHIVHETEGGPVGAVVREEHKQEPVPIKHLYIMV